MMLRPVPLLPVDAEWCLDTFGRLPVTRAVPLLGPDATDDEWLEARRTRIGASELAGIAGMPGAYGSWYASWYAKTEGWLSDVTMAMRIGHLLEPVIASIALEEKPWLTRLVRPGARLLGHPDVPWLCCTPDYLAIAEPVDDCILPMRGTATPCCQRQPGGSHQLDCPDRGCAEHGDPVAVPVECKSDEGGQEWGADMSRQAPLKYIAQNLIQADVLGTPYGWLAHLAGKRFSLHLVDPAEHRDWYQSMVSDGERFMADLAAGCEPALEDVDGSTATLEALLRRFPDVADAEEDHRKVFLPGDLATQFRGSRRLLAEAKEYKQLIDNRIRHVLGHAAEGLAPDGSTVVRRSIYARRAYRVGESTVDQLSVVNR